jgi:HrpA-like RNA helicase
MDLLKNNKSKSKTISKSKSVKSVKKSLTSNNVEKKILSHIKPSSDSYIFYDAFLTDEQKAAFQKPIGIFDPLGENINPLTGMPYQNIYMETTPITYDSGPAQGQSVPKTYRNWAYVWTNLPLYSKVSEVVKSIRENSMTIIKAGTGTGKSFFAGRMCSQAFNFQKKVLMTLMVFILLSID